MSTNIDGACTNDRSHRTSYLPQPATVTVSTSSSTMSHTEQRALGLGYTAALPAPQVRKVRMPAPAIASSAKFADRRSETDEHRVCRNQCWRLKLPPIRQFSSQSGPRSDALEEAQLHGTTRTIDTTGRVGLVQCSAHQPNQVLDRVGDFIHWAARFGHLPNRVRSSTELDRRRLRPPLGLRPPGDPLW
jgi:hypothetical protein